MYAVYKDDELLFIGTREEIAKRFNIKLSSVKWLCTPAAHRRSDRCMKVYFVGKRRDCE